MIISLKNKKLNITNRTSEYSEVVNIKYGNNTINFYFDELNVILAPKDFKFSVIRNNKNTTLNSKEVKIGDKILVDYFFIDKMKMYILPNNKDLKEIKNEL